MADNNTNQNQTAATPAPAASAVLNQSGNQPQAPGTASNAAKAAPAAPAKGMHHLSYIGQGIWKDAEGQNWCREEKNNCISDKNLTAAELEKRPDLKYMIKYGAMKDIVIE